VSLLQVDVGGFKATMYELIRKASLPEFQMDETDSDVEESDERGPNMKKKRNNSKKPKQKILQQNMDI
jgi:hypothetical protein